MKILRMPNLSKSMSAKMSVARFLKQNLGFGEGLIPDRKKQKYNKRYAKKVMHIKPVATISTKSNRIEDIQKQLKKLGYLKGNPTGILDLATIAAITKFQEKEGLSKSGMLDLKTLARLEKMIKG